MDKDASKPSSSPSGAAKTTESATPMAIKSKKRILQKWKLASLNDILPADLRPPNWSEHILACLDTLSKHESLRDAREMLADQVRRRIRDDRAQKTDVLGYLTKRDADEVVRQCRNHPRSSSSREVSEDTRNETPLSVDAHVEQPAPEARVQTDMVHTETTQTEDADAGVPMDVDDDPVRPPCPTLPICYFFPPFLLFSPSSSFSFPFFFFFFFFFSFFFSFLVFPPFQLRHI